MTHPAGLFFLGAGVARGAGRPLIVNGKPCLNEKLEMRNAKWWCGAKNNEAPQCIDGGDAMRWYFSD